MRKKEALERENTLGILCVLCWQVCQWDAERKRWQCAVCEQERDA